MATTEPVNTQQLLQMGSHTEKLQQTLQHQGIVHAQQLDEERIKATELKNNEVQVTKDSEAMDASNPDGRPASGRIRTRKKKENFLSDKKKENILNLNEKQQGNKINVVA